jgi:hypothetical protein
MAIKRVGERDSVYETFAMNLQSRVLERGSISQTCASLNINRQQFNKYLNGTMLPNDVTMGKIITYLGVDLVQLFEDHHLAQSHELNTPLNYPDKDHRFEKTLEQVKAHSSKCKFPEGVYYCYVPWLPSLELCLRSLVVLKRIDSRLVFTRLIRIDELGKLQKKYKPRLQEGIVTQHRNFITLTGTEPKQDHRKMMMSFAQDDVPLHGCMGGLLSTHALTDLPICCRVILHYQGPNINWRQHYRNCGLMAIDHPSIRPDAANLILKYFHDQNSILQTFDQMEAWRE